MKHPHININISILSIVQAACLIFHLSACDAFTSLHTSSLFNTHTTKLSTNTQRPLFTRKSIIHKSSSDDMTTSSSPSSLSRSNKVFVLSFDGVVANSAESRACIAVDAALETWPFLKDNEMVSADRTWLINKIKALLHVTQGSMEGVMGCEAVLLARMLIEEQALDGGKSVGKSGKYASKYHPSSVQSSSSDGDNDNDDDEGVGASNRRAKNGSRPLTVGEIAANWADGAYLAETLFVKYNIEGKSPLPTIRANLARLQAELVSDG